jgi:hypothetical protein
MRIDAYLQQIANFAQSDLLEMSYLVRQLSTFSGVRYIRQYNKAPQTAKWKYFDPSRRITTKSVVTGH